MDVAGWLRALGLEKYQATFCEHEITAAVLPNLSADDLKDLGIAAVGHRRRLLDAIALLRVGNEPVGVPSLGEPQAIGQPTAERRQLTVMFCDVMDFTPLSSRLDPEDLSTVSTRLPVLCGDDDRTLRRLHRSLCGRWRVDLFRLARGP